MSYNPAYPSAGAQQAPSNQYGYPPQPPHSHYQPQPGPPPPGYAAGSPNAGAGAHYQPYAGAPLTAYGAGYMHNQYAPGVYSSHGSYPGANYQHQYANQPSYPPQPPQMYGAPPPPNGAAGAPHGGYYAPPPPGPPQHQHAPQYPSAPHPQYASTPHAAGYAVAPHQAGSFPPATAFTGEAGGVSSANQHMPQWQASEEISKTVDGWFDTLAGSANASQDETIVIAGTKVAGFLKDSNLPVAILREIWGLVDQQKTGSINRRQFQLIIRLVSISSYPVYAGAAPSLERFCATVHDHIPLAPGIVSAMESASSSEALDSAQAITKATSSTAGEGSARSGMGSFDALQAAGELVNAPLPPLAAINTQTPIVKCGDDDDADEDDDEFTDFAGASSATAHTDTATTAVFSQSTPISPRREDTFGTVITPPKHPVAATGDGSGGGYSGDAPMMMANPLTPFDLSYGSQDAAASAAAAAEALVSALGENSVAAATSAGRVDAFISLIEDALGDDDDDDVGGANVDIQSVKHSWTGSFAGGGRPLANTSATAIQRGGVGGGGEGESIRNNAGMRGAVSMNSLFSLSNSNDESENSPKEGGEGLPGSLLFNSTDSTLGIHAPFPFSAAARGAEPSSSQPAPSVASLPHEYTSSVNGNKDMNGAGKVSVFDDLVQSDDATAAVTSDVSGGGVAGKGQGSTENEEEEDWDDFAEASPSPTATGTPAAAAAKSSPFDDFLSFDEDVHHHNASATLYPARSPAAAVGVGGSGGGVIIQHTQSRAAEEAGIAQLPSMALPSNSSSIVGASSALFGTGATSGRGDVSEKFNDDEDFGDWEDGTTPPALNSLSAGPTATAHTSLDDDFVVVDSSTENNRAGIYGKMEAMAGHTAAPPIAGVNGHVENDDFGDFGDFESHTPSNPPPTLSFSTSSSITSAVPLALPLPLPAGAIPVSPSSSLAPAAATKTTTAGATVPGIDEIDLLFGEHSFPSATLSSLKNPSTLFHQPHKQEQAAVIDLLDMDFLSDPIPPALTASISATTDLNARTSSSADGNLVEDFDLFGSEFQSATLPPSSSGLPPKHTSTTAGNSQSNHSNKGRGATNPRTDIKDIRGSASIAVPSPSPQFPAVSSVSASSTSTLPSSAKLNKRKGSRAGLSVSDLELVSLTLSEKHLYEYAYASARQASMLKVVQEMSENHTKALESGLLEVAEAVKDEISLVAGKLATPDEEAVWSDAAYSDSVKKGESIEEIAEFIGDLDPQSASLFREKFVLLPATATATAAASSSPAQDQRSKGKKDTRSSGRKGKPGSFTGTTPPPPPTSAPIEERMKFALLAKRSASVITQLSTTHTEHKELWRKLLAAVAVRLDEGTTMLSGFRDLSLEDQAAVRAQKRLQNYIQGLVNVAELGIWLSTSCCEGLVHTNQAEFVFQQSQSVLKSAKSLFALESECLNRSMEDLMLEAGQRSDLPGCLLCETTLRPIAISQQNNNNSNGNSTEEEDQTKTIQRFALYTNSSLATGRGLELLHAANFWKHEVEGAGSRPISAQGIC